MLIDISCREADWKGTDREDLQYVSPDNHLIVLHLDHLTTQDVLKILGHKEEIAEPNEFFKMAQRHNLEELLYNPQVLNLLVKAVNENNARWPKNRTEIYEMACSNLVSEENTRHRQAKLKKPDIKAISLLDAAGYLSAIQLLSGISGFALDKGAADEQYCDVLNLTEPKKYPLLPALETNLFTANGEQKRIPAHRSIAEYLAGRYLAGLAGPPDRLPIGRILALMPNETGIVESDLRGVMAWLSVHCTPPQRRTLIERDPMGLLAYGDVNSFCTTDKELMIDVLKKNNQWASEKRALSGLSTLDMAPTFLKILDLPSRTDFDQRAVAIVLDAITYGESIPKLAGAIDVIVRDHHRPPFVRQSALNALINNTTDYVRPLKLADDIQDKLVDDWNDDLLGSLLIKLYPKTITHSKVLNYLHYPKHQGYFGNYFTFWNNELLKLTDPKDTPFLLDQFTQRKEELRQLTHIYRMNEFTIKLLLTGLYNSKETELNGKRLYQWFDLLSPVIPERSCKEEIEKIANWIEQHSDLCNSLLEHAKLLEKLPVAFSKFLQLKPTVSSLLDEWNKPCITTSTVDPIEKKYDLEVKKRANELQHKKEQWVAYFRQHIQAIQNASELGILCDLARAYNGDFPYQAPGKTPEERLSNFLNNDQNLVQAAHEGFRRVLDRSDLPPISAIIDLELQNKSFTVSIPCLVGMDELYQKNSVDALALNDEILSKMLAFRFVSDFGEASPPTWVNALVRSRPVFAADVFLAYLAAAVRANKEHIKGLFRLGSHEDAYSHMASIVVWPLLENFPARASEHLWKNDLVVFLKLGIQIDGEKSLAIIEHKLKSKSMHVGQKVIWLVYGLILDPSTYSTKLREYIKKNASYRLNFAKLLHQNEFPFFDLNEAGLGLLIELFAPECKPESLLEGSWAGPDYFIRFLITRLRGKPSQAASDELKRLLKLDTLSLWYTELSDALYIQQISKYKASFRPLGIKEITRTLANLEPANPGDLATLVLESLKNYEEEVRTSPYNLKKQYWSYYSASDNRKKIKRYESKPENDCRDILLGALKLPKGVSASKEAYCVDDNRADIKISFKEYSIHIEIKKDSHRDIFKAIRNQLIEKYTCDRSSGGYGIYLVFWFGENMGPRKPKNAEDLKWRLQETLTTEEKQYIQICVIDCTLKL